MITKRLLRLSFALENAELVSVSDVFAKVTPAAKWLQGSSYKYKEKEIQAELAYGCISEKVVFSGSKMPRFSASF